MAYQKLQTERAYNITTYPFKTSTYNPSLKYVYTSTDGDISLVAPVGTGGTFTFPKGAPNYWATAPTVTVTATAGAGATFSASIASDGTLVITVAGTVTTAYSGTITLTVAKETGTLAPAYYAQPFLVLVGQGGAATKSIVGKTATGDSVTITDTFIGQIPPIQYSEITSNGTGALIALW